MGLLSSLVPAPYRFAAAALACVLLVAAAGAWVHSYGSKRYAAGAESVRAEYRAAAEQAAETARLLSRERSAAAERIDREAVARLRASADAAAARRVDGDGLRLALANRGQPAAGADTGQCSAERARADVLAGLLDEATGLLQEGGDAVDRAVVVIDGLQARGQVR